MTAVLTLAALAPAACSKPEAVEIPPPKVGVAEVLATQIAPEFRFPGRTEAPQRVEIRPQVEGVIHQRFFTDGQRVEQGKPLFQIDARSPEAALAEAKAGLAKSKVNASDAQKVALRTKSLYEQRAVSLEEYQNAQADADAAKALVVANQAMVKNASLTRGYATIVAPFDGRVSRAEADVGSYVTPGSTRLTVVARLDPMYATFALSERQFLRLPGNQERREQLRNTVAEAKPASEDPAEAAGDEPTEQADAAAKSPGKDGGTPPPPDAAAAPGADGNADDELGSQFEEINRDLMVTLELADGTYHPYQGVLQIVSVELDAKTGTYPMRAVFPNAEDLLLPNLYGHVVLRRREKQDAILVPQDALVLKQVGVVVYVVGEGNTLEEREVDVGQRVGSLAEITKGLSKGEKVVVSGVHKCRDDLVIAPKEVEPLTLESDPLAVEPRPGPEGWFKRFQAEKRTAALVGG